MFVTSWPKEEKLSILQTVTTLPFSINIWERSLPILSLSISIRFPQHTWTVNFDEYLGTGRARFQGAAPRKFPSGISSDFWSWSMEELFHDGEKVVEELMHRAGGENEFYGSCKRRIHCLSSDLKERNYAIIKMSGSLIASAFGNNISPRSLAISMNCCIISMRPTGYRHQNQFWKNRVKCPMKTN